MPSNETCPTTSLDPDISTVNQGEGLREFFMLFQPHAPVVSLPAQEDGREHGS